MKSMIKKNKKGISEIVSYVLLIIIGISISVMVYTWINSYLPSENERQKCPEDVALTITNYECYKIDNENILSLKIENRGFFNVDGFYIRAGNDSSKLPITNLRRTDVSESEMIPGQYLKYIPVGTKINASFYYGNLTTIKRVQIQPIYNVTLCPSVVDIKLEEC